MGEPPTPAPSPCTATITFQSPGKRPSGTNSVHIMCRLTLELRHEGDSSLRRPGSQATTEVHGCGGVETGAGKLVSTNLSSP